MRDFNMIFKASGTAEAASPTLNLATVAAGISDALLVREAFGEKFGPTGYIGSTAVNPRWNPYDSAVIKAAVVTAGTTGSTFTIVTGDNVDLTTGAVIIASANVPAGLGEFLAVKFPVKDLKKYVGVKWTLQATGSVVQSWIDIE